MLKKNILIFSVFIFSTVTYSFPIPFAFVKVSGGADPCTVGTPSAGTVCSDGSIYVGIFGPRKYRTTPGGCTDSATPVCAGGTDSLEKAWNGSTGTNVDIATVTNITVNADPSPVTETGDIITPLIVADASVSSDSASDYCNDMTFGGDSSWFLPAKSEMAFLYCHANVAGGTHHTSYPAEDINCVSVGGKSSLIGGFNNTNYWVSTERTTSVASTLHFNNGFQGGRSKVNNDHVRCMRSYDKCDDVTTIGASCPGGAIYAGEFDGGKYAITPGDCTDSATPTCDGTEDSLNKRWRGTSGSDADVAGVENVTGTVTTSSSSFRGDVNTPLIAADASVDSDSAADFCNDMVYGGYDDWYLPSKSELAYIYCRSDSGGTHNVLYPHEDPNCASIGGKTTELPDFNGNSYWASTEGSGSSNGQGLQFSNGSQGGSFSKASTLRVRCVRRF